MDVNTFINMNINLKIYVCMYVHDGETANESFNEAFTKVFISTCEIAVNADFCSNRKKVASKSWQGKAGRIIKSKIATQLQYLFLYFFLFFVLEENQTSFYEREHIHPYKIYGNVNTTLS